MRTLVWILACLCAANALGCSVATDVDGYAFEDSPCPRPAHACPGGRALWFVISRGDIARSVGDEIAGFNLDATAEAVCGHADKISPVGTPGIDNAASPLLAVLEDPMHRTDEVLFEGLLSGVITVLQVNHVDDLVSDDCVDVQIRRAAVPSGQDPPTYLDADRDGMLDPDLHLNVNSITARDDRACITGGILHANEGDLPTLFPSTPVPMEVDTTALHLRAQVSETGLTEGWQGGGVSVVDLVSVLHLEEQPFLVSVLETSADLYPMRDGSCSHISFAYTFEAIPFTPQVSGTPP